MIDVKEIYLWLVRLMSLMSSWHRKNQVIYLMSFGDNVPFIEALVAALPAGTKVTVFYRPQQQAAAARLAQRGIETVIFRDDLGFVFKGIPRIMRARLIFCDNYYAFLGGLRHPKQMRIVQVWHAVGAIKRFGWDDPTTVDRSASDKRRFQAVYDHFDEVVVASPAMGQVFATSYHLSPKRMQVLGYPRSDRLLDPKWLTTTRERVYREAPALAGHRVIVYAPTYREGVTFAPPAGLAAALTSDPDARVVVKLHPALVAQSPHLQQALGDQLVTAKGLSTTELLTVAETLITDYSSVAFDYSLLPNAHSLLFYLFDLSTYKLGPGVQPDLLDWLPSPALTDNDQLTAAIQQDAAVDFTQFNSHWNRANDGKATQRVVARYVALLTN
ncbi:glycosyl glycerophosphate transferase [Levilactobacillus senmaizukei DSM 21775 = NBRC 103853]|uniref:Glycosyl glycerophosphate transferase n=1 Tax=Levilactobacillus senmaizukei DSM 21775 = NBRC 103853 TaxID=1423803 RepID=A0A0R2DF06_9LACO|nr:CDP-glycerol glycerophosphotransferase family protein [Levilactobacillus senmaizukei]KRN02600.1 glycosyl glycerophosphate transferase [Levilactobacillus senmaizukei DSM 21775 = NBRC 103853]